MRPCVRDAGFVRPSIERRPGPEIDSVAEMEELPHYLPAADAIIVSLPTTSRTDSFISRRESAQMKEGGLFVNVGRGSVVDEDAFVDAMENERLGAAGLDTWWNYPKDQRSAVGTPPSRHRPERFENLVLSPHRANHVLGRKRQRIVSLAEIVGAIAKGRSPRPVDRSVIRLDRDH